MALTRIFWQDVSSSVENTPLKMKSWACCMRVTRENFWARRKQFKCRHLESPFGYSQRSGLLQSLEEASVRNVPHVRWPQRFQNPCDDDIRGHGAQVWSYDRTSSQGFCARKPASSVVFRSGHNIQNRTARYWFCTLLQIMDSQFHNAILVEEKDFRWPHKFFN